MGVIEQGVYTPIEYTQYHDFKFTLYHDTAPSMFMMYTADKIPVSEYTIITAFNICNLMPRLNWEGSYAGHMQYNFLDYVNGMTVVGTNGASLNGDLFKTICQSSKISVNISQNYFCKNTVYKWVAVWF